MKSVRLVGYGVPGLVAQAIGMYELVVLESAVDGVNFIGIGVGPKKRCPYLPKINENDTLCRFRLRCTETSEAFETCGYVTKLFLRDAFAPRKGKRLLTVGGEKMVRRKKPSLLQYVLDIENMDAAKH